MYENARPLMDDREWRDRLARAEQNIINQEKNFNGFKAEDFGSLKAEVHSMRGEFNDKLDKQDQKMDVMLEKIGSINLVIAKWLGAGGVLIFLGELILKKIFGV